MFIGRLAVGFCFAKKLKKRKYDIIRYNIVGDIYELFKIENYG